MKIILLLATVLLSACNQPSDQPDVLDDDVELSWYYDKDGEVVWVQCERITTQEDNITVERLINCEEI